MVEAIIPNEFQNSMFPHAFKFAFQMKLLEVITIDGKIKSRVKHFTEKLPIWVKILGEFGERGTLKMGQRMDPKSAPRGQTCRLVGFSKNHGKDSYVMLKLSHPFAKLVTRDVTFLNCKNFPSVDNNYLKPLTMEYKLNTYE